MTLLIEGDIYTKKDRLNRSALARELNIKQNEIDFLFYECQKEMSVDTSCLTQVKKPDPKKSFTSKPFWERKKKGGKIGTLKRS